MNRFKLYTFYILLFFLLGQVVLAKSKIVKKADSYFEVGEYYQALSKYQEAIDLGEEFDVETQKRLANCYFQLNDIENALNTFLNVYDDITGDDVLTFAMTMQRAGGYEMAIDLYERAKTEGASGMSSSQIDELIESCKWSLENNSFVDYRVNPSNIFTFGQSFGIQYYENGVVYSSSYSEEDNSSKKNKGVDRQGKTYLNLFYSELDGSDIKEGKLFSKNLVFDYHVGAISFSPDYKTMFYTRTLRLRGGKSRLKIYRVKNDGEKWLASEEMPFNSDDFDCAHPAVSPDGDYLYFTSNKLGGFGKKDIYKVKLNADGSCGEMENLGNGVNTYGDEMFPFIAKDGSLYFSSDGLLGFGGLDIYKAKLTNGSYSEPKNLLKPFNSERDDFGYVQNPNNNKLGFLSSNRLGTGNTDAIFYFYYNGPEDALVEGNAYSSEDEYAAVAADINGIMASSIAPGAAAVSSSKSQFPSSVNLEMRSTLGNESISGVECVIMDDATGKVVASAKSDANGNVVFDIPDEYRVSGTIFDVKFSLEGEYKTQNSKVKIEDLDNFASRGIQLTPIFNDLVLDDIGGMIMPYEGMELTDESLVILGKLAEYLKNNSNVVIKLNAHTEKRGNRVKNLQDSQKIAEKTKQMLIDLGVDPSNVIPRGYSDRYPINDCSEGLNGCTEDQILENRRIEVVVWRMK